MPPNILRAQLPRYPKVILSSLIFFGIQIEIKIIHTVNIFLMLFGKKLLVIEVLWFTDTTLCDATAILFPGSSTPDKLSLFYILPTLSDLFGCKSLWSRVQRPINTCIWMGWYCLHGTGIVCCTMARVRLYSFDGVFRKSGTLGGLAGSKCIFSG